MKKLILLLLALVLLTGCTGNSYLSIEPHSRTRMESTDAITVENYNNLSNALIQQVDLHRTQFRMFTYSYSGDVEQDVARAVNYVRTSYPLGAYAIQTLYYDLDQVASYYQIEFTLTYAHTAWELAQIQQVRMDNLEQVIGDAMTTGRDEQVLMISGYRSVDLVAYCMGYARNHLDTVMQVPTVTCEVWPDSGSVRIVELSYAYTANRYELQQMQQQVDEILDEGVGYLAYGSTQTEQIALLHTFLSERYAYIPGESDTPAWSMLCQGIADAQTYTEVFRILCQRAGIECYAVDGLKNGELYRWDLVQADGRYYHMDPYAAELSGQTQLPLYLDEQMTGYVWDRSAYPTATE